jgi:hypothetical protein
MTVAHERREKRKRLALPETDGRGTVPTLADLLDLPGRALELPPADAAAILAKVEGLASVLRIAASPGAARNLARTAGDGIPGPEHPTLRASARSEAVVPAWGSTGSARDPAPEGWLTPADAEQAALEKATAGRA